MLGTFTNRLIQNPKSLPPLRPGRVPLYSFKKVYMRLIADKHYTNDFNAYNP